MEYADRVLADEQIVAAVYEALTRVAPIARRSPLIGQCTRPISGGTPVHGEEDRRNSDEDDKSVNPKHCDIC